MWIDKEPKKNVTELCDYGGSPAVSHSVMCWICDKEPAVYSTWPNFIFIPCWKCQKKYKGWWTKKKKWWEFWKKT